MPTSDYKDNDTGEVFEMYFRTREIPETVINPKTGNTSTRILTTGSIGFEFKGPGFYATEYKNKGN